MDIRGARSIMVCHCSCDIWLFTQQLAMTFSSVICWTIFYCLLQVILVLNIQKCTQPVSRTGMPSLVLRWISNTSVSVMVSVMVGVGVCASWRRWGFSFKEDVIRKTKTRTRQSRQPVPRFKNLYQCDIGFLPQLPPHRSQWSELYQNVTRWVD